MSDPESNKSHAARTDSVSQSDLVRAVLARANKAGLADAGLDADLPTIAGLPGINEIINTADIPRQDDLLLQQPVKSKPPIQDYEIPTPQQDPWPYQLPIVLVPVNLTQRLTHLTQRLTHLTQRLREVIAEIPTQDQQRFIALSRTDQKAQLETLIRLRHGRLEKMADTSSTAPTSTSRSVPPAISPCLGPTLA
ncbi:hypothetical protein VTO58DRAFT_100557 [Aureobasidium pullulans]